MRWTWTCDQRILSFQHLSLPLQYQMKSWRTIFVSPPWHTSVNFQLQISLSYSLHQQPLCRTNISYQKNQDTTHLGKYHWFFTAKLWPSESWTWTCWCDWSPGAWNFEVPDFDWSSSSPIFTGNRWKVNRPQSSRIFRPPVIFITLLGYWW